MDRITKKNRAECTEQPIVRIREESSETMSNVNRQIRGVKGSKKLFIMNVDGVTKTGMEKIYSFIIRSQPCHAC